MMRDGTDLRFAWNRCNSTYFAFLKGIDEAALSDVRIADQADGDLLLV
jgi:hypothetical protein